MNRTTRSKVKPTTVVVGSFALLIVIGTVLLATPWAADPLPGSLHVRHTSVLDALFTATSAVSLTGLITLDTAVHWSAFGKIVIVLLIQLGGLGFMTIASLFGLFIGDRLGLKRRAEATVEGRGVDLGEISWVIRASLSFTLVTEFLVFLALMLRLRLHYGHTWAYAAWEGVFHAISSFNNAGFGLRSDNLVGYNTDAWVLLPIAFSLMIGGLGFPVLLEIWRRCKTFVGGVRHRSSLTRLPRPKRWSLTTRFTVIGTVFLVAFGWVLVAAGEWNHAMAGLGAPAKVLNAFFSGVSPRTAGFNSLDYAEFRPVTLLGTDMLMFIGGGSGGTAGGVKITTAAVILVAVISQIRGQASDVVASRKLSLQVLREALVILAFGSGLIISSVFAILVMAPEFTTDQVGFEVISAFSTVGLSTGITHLLPSGAQFILIVLMFAGRIGPVVLATALASRNQHRQYDYPEERPTIG